MYQFLYGIQDFSLYVTRVRMQQVTIRLYYVAKFSAMVFDRLNLLRVSG